ncbi:MAG: formylglycine-generating enzyme family protein [Flavobacteriales bacterium]
MKQNHLLIISAILLFSFTLFGKKENKSLPKAYRDQFGFVPVGEVEMGGQKQTTTAFFMMKNEVTNGEYNAFLSDLKAQGKMDEFNRYQIDSIGWRTLNPYNEPFVQYYHTHPAYANYPVCNVSYDGAIAYAAWMESKLNASTAKTGYAYDVRLPSKAEWIRAANGTFQQPNYAWGGPHIRDSRGIGLCNYNGLQHENDTTRWTIIDPDNATMTAPSNSYSPNAFGLYNMNGNIEEMIQERGTAMGGSWRSCADAVYNTSEATYTSSSPSLGFRCLVTLRAVSAS